MSSRPARWACAMTAMLACAGAAAACEAPAALDGPRAGHAPAAQGPRLYTRTFWDAQSFDGRPGRRATVQSLRVDYDASCPLAHAVIGLNVSLFAAWKLAGSDNAGTLAQVDDAGRSLDDRAWAAVGQYMLTLDAGNVDAKLGLQRANGQYFAGKENRALPPTFRGLSVVSKAGPLHVEAGTFDAVLGRGHAHLGRLSSAYGGTEIPRLGYLGAALDAQGSGVSVFIERAENVWDKLYLESRYATAAPSSVQWTAVANLYLTKDQGRHAQGKLKGQAFSVAIGAKQGAYATVVAYQKIASDQVHDFVAETAGASLANQMFMDFGAPHEQSLQVRGEVDGARVGWPGLTLALWKVWGWGADGQAMALVHGAPDDALHSLYWRDAQPVHGRHWEVGLNAAYVFQHGHDRNARLKLFAARHTADAFYSDGNAAEYRLMLDFSF